MIEHSITRLRNYLIGVKDTLGQALASDAELVLAVAGRFPHLVQEIRTLHNLLDDRAAQIHELQVKLDELDNATRNEITELKAALSTLESNHQC